MQVVWDYSENTVGKPRGRLLICGTCGYAHKAQLRPGLESNEKPEGSHEVTNQEGQGFNIF